MSWSLPIYQSVALSELFQQTLSALSPASTCMSGVDGKSLWIETLNPADTATLPTVMQTCHQYLNLTDGEFAICNDPYTGGTDLSQITLVIGLGALSGVKADFILGVRFALEPRWRDTGKLADEGVRIPPTPVGTLHKPNWDLLAMIGSQPQTPRGFDHTLRMMIEQIVKVHASFQHALGEKNALFHKACAKDFLDSSVRAFRKHLGHLALGESFASTRLKSGELIKLRLKVEEEKILFDFSGTDPSSGIHLTELMTFGTCFSAIQDALGLKVVCNSGAFESIVVSAPAKTLLNAKAPSGTWRGSYEGAGELRDFLASHLRKTIKSQTLAPVASHAGFVDVTFKESNQGFFYALPNGANADAKPPASAAWLSSIEELESTFPVYIRQFGERRDSGGAGQTRGGNRLGLTFEMLEPAHVRWNFEAAAIDLQGTVNVIDANLTDHVQNAKGSANLTAGQVLIVTSAAGRGRGETVTDDDAT